MKFLTIMQQPPADPFLIKKLPRAHPVRIAFTARARFADWKAKNQFSRYLIPFERPSVTHEIGNLSYEQSDTAVTPAQMEALLSAVRMTEEISTPIVEIGSYRGVTTALIASQTKRMIHAIDPYAGYGGASLDLAMFQNRTLRFPNVLHHCCTSGEAATHPNLERISFAFIDAVHDYVNVRFDGSTWLQKLGRGGMIAFHDTDSLVFPGVMRAVWEILNDPNRSLQLFHHVPGLVILQRN